MRVDPAREVPAGVAIAGQITTVLQVAVGQQHRIRSLVGTQQDRVGRHHIGPVQEVGDASETLGFALCEEGIVADVQAHQLGVLGRLAGGENLKVEGASLGRWQVFQHQLVTFDLERSAGAVDQHAGEVQVLAIQAQGLHWYVRVAAQPHLAQHPGLGRVEVQSQVDGVDPEWRRGVISALHAHCRPLAIAVIKHGMSPESCCGSGRDSW